MARSIALVAVLLAGCHLVPGSDAYFFAAVERGDEDAVSEMLDERPSRIHLRDDYGLQPIHVAIERDRPETLAVLLEHGARFDVVDDQRGTRPLQLARSSTVVRLLADAGAQLDGADFFGLTALHTAAYDGRFEVAAALLLAGAGPDGRDATDGQTPLQLAIRNGNRDVARLLIAGGADIDNVDHDGSTALHDVMLSPYGPLMQTLIDRSKHRNLVRKRDGLTPLQIARRGGNVAAVEKLEAAGATEPESPRPR